MNITSEEITFTNNVIEIIEWEDRNVPVVKNVKVLHAGFVPIIINDLFITNMAKVSDYSKNNNIIPFRPIRNGRHCQFLIDFLFENEDSIEDLYVKKENNRSYSGYLLYTNGEKKKLKGFYTETELKFALFYLHYFDEDITKKLKFIHEYNETHKDEQEIKRFKKNSKKKKQPSFRIH